MLRKLTVILLSGVIGLLGVTPLLAAEYNEAPMLKALVDRGELPPVGERLPDEPCVIEPFEEIGQYGGTLRMLNPSAAEWGEPANSNMEHLFCVDSNYETILPNVAKSWAFSEGGKVLTVNLRKGMKWSDGAPFTVDDLVFGYQDITLNKELTPWRDSMWKGAELEKVDDYTFRWHFPEPSPNILLPLAGLWFGSWQSSFDPKHYLKSFHIKYNAEADELAKEAGYEHWWQLFNEKRTFNPTMQANPDLPSLTPWVVKKVTPSSVSWERNPYYWKVDPAGNQLPYIDKMTGVLAETPELYSMKVLSGEVDFTQRELTIEDYPLFVENAEKGQYRVWLDKSSWAASPAVYLNLNYDKDPMLRDIMRNVKFRHAVSLAINREEINEMVFYGLATPCQATVSPDASFYEEKFARSYAEYNPQKSESLLDEIGLDERGEEGYRLRPDGKTLTLTITLASGGGKAWESVTELVRDYWRKIGIKVLIRPIDRGLFWDLIDASELQATVWCLDSHSSMVFPMVVGRLNVWQSFAWGIQWQIWANSGGEEGQEPPEEIKKLFSLSEKLWHAFPEERDQIAKEILQLQAENLFAIGTCGYHMRPVIARINLMNINENAWAMADAGGTRFLEPSQWFFKK